MTSPLVSIGMPVRNGERYLRQALDSLLAQDYPHLELVICDNASTDATAAICRDAAARDPRVVVIRREVSCPAEENFNRALTFARGEYFMWAACDDLWEPEFVSAALNGLRTIPGAALSFSTIDVIDEVDVHGRMYRLCDELPAGPVPASSRLRQFLQHEELQGKANLIYGLMPTAVLRAAGGLYRRGWGADMHVVFRILSRGPLALDPRVLFHKRIETRSGPARGFLARAAGWTATSLAQARYLAGYIPLIFAAPGLAVATRIRLLGALILHALRMAVVRLRSPLRDRA